MKDKSLYELSSILGGLEEVLEARKRNRQPELEDHFKRVYEFQLTRLQGCGMERLAAAYRKAYDGD